MNISFFTYAMWSLVVIQVWPCLRSCLKPCLRSCLRSTLCQTWNLLKIYTFRAKEFYTLKKRKSRLFLPATKSKNASLSVIWPSLFWLKLNKMCKFFNSYEESLHFGMCKLAKYIRNCVVFWKKLAADKNLTREPVATNSKSGGK